MRRVRQALVAVSLSLVALPRVCAVDLSASQDTTLCEDGTGLQANGAGQYLFTGKTAAANVVRRGLIEFDIAGQIPAGATILSATLTLNMSRTIAGPSPVELYAVTQSWGEGASDAPGEEGDCNAVAVAPDATWLFSAVGTSSWITPGGDFVAAPSAVQIVDSEGFYTWGSSAEMVADVQSWLDLPSTNFGWLMLGDESVNVTAKRFDTREHPDPLLRPVLSVTFSTGGMPVIVYGLINPVGIVAPGNEVGMGPSPIDFIPAGDARIYYQADDGTGNPAVIQLIETATGIRVTY